MIKWSFVAPDALTGCGDVDLVATFPEFYPFLRPDVAAPGVDMAHHQHPFGKNLCLIGRASAAWDTSNDLAWLIQEQLPKALTLGESPERGGDEEDQGEPFSDYYPYRPNAMALIDSAWTPPSGSVKGTVTLRVSGPMPLREDAQNLFIIESVTNHAGERLFRMPAPVREHYKAAAEWTAQWTHLPQPAKASTGDGLWSASEEQAGPHAQPLSCNGTDFELRLVSFPEEHSQTTTGTGWVLLVRELGQLHQPSRKDSKSGNPARRAPRRGQPTVHLIRAGRIGPSDMTARLDPSSPLSSTRVLLLGAGAVGSVIADQLARAGILGLTVIDHDVLEPGNLVRHANNLSFVGAHKSGAAASLALQVNPYIEVQAFIFPIGSTAVPAEQRSILTREYERADLIIDATAEIGVQRLSASLARQTQKPWIGAWATNGAIGGVVAHIPANAPWCFACFEWTRQDNPGLLPPASPAPLTQPIGCAEPTFLGPAHNLNEVSLHAVRTAHAVLAGKATHPVAVFSLAKTEDAELPRWDPFSITPHQNCSHQ
ncbi:ThiF family adenylyltransferase [Paenarthrobacter nicotinovorans]|uniref:ThiF family adenylyltransferase n=1 Tax=Paenarthrobacter nicotinovorans TaxID=29320 RepID=UPI0024859202|nr:ThiF family adenylyltransferase [Paenarthrobacter nicotinovorans]